MMIGMIVLVQCWRDEWGTEWCGVLLFPSDPQTLMIAKLKGMIRRRLGECVAS